MSEEELVQETIVFHQGIKSLPGFGSAIYYNAMKNNNAAGISFETVSATDSALEIIRPGLIEKIPAIRIIKTEVEPGSVIPSA